MICPRVLDSTVTGVLAQPSSSRCRACSWVRPSSAVARIRSGGSGGMNSRFFFFIDEVSFLRDVFFNRCR